MKRTTQVLWKSAGAASLLTGLVSSWDAPAEAQPYNFAGQLTPTHDLSNVYFLFAVGTCSPGGGIFAEKISDFIPANTAYSFNLSFQSIPDGLGPGYGYAIAGLYDPINGGVSMSLDSTWAANLLAISPAPQWDGAWLPLSNGNLFYQFFTGESDIAVALQSGVCNGVAMNDARTQGPFDPGDYFFPRISTDPSSPSAFQMINFSTPSDGGTGFIVETVPEPATLSLLLAGAVVAGGVRRRLAR